MKSRCHAWVVHGRRVVGELHSKTAPSLVKFGRGVAEFVFRVRASCSRNESNAPCTQMRWKPRIVATVFELRACFEECPGMMVRA